MTGYDMPNHLTPELNKHLVTWQEGRRLVLSQTTVRTYIFLVCPFLVWLSQQLERPVSPTDLNAANVRKYIAAYAPTRTVTARLSCLSAIRNFIKWLVDEECLPSDPTGGIRAGKYRKVERKPMSEDEIDEAFEACNRFPQVKRGILARAMLSTLVYTGIRIGSLVDIRMKDVDLVKKTLFLRTMKEGKTATKVIPDECLQALKDLVAVRPAGCLHDYFFAVTAKLYLTSYSATYIMQELAALCGKRDASHWRCHNLRHAYAMRLLANGARLDQVKNALDHDSLVTTEVYLHMSPADKQQIALLARRGALPSAPNPPEPKVLEQRYAFIEL